MDTITTAVPINPLRQRFQHDMMMRDLGPHTENDYIRHVRRFAAFLSRPPDTSTAEDLRNFQIHQNERGASGSTINGADLALRFFYAVTLGRQNLARGLDAMRRPHKMREVLSVEETAWLLEAAPGIKYNAALGVAYGAGLPASEVAHLKVDNIDSQRMLIRVGQGKGGKDRNAMVSPQLLELLRLWWREGKGRGVMV
jgi:integrase/recombinase XerD